MLNPMTIHEALSAFIAYGRAERQYAKETLAKLKECFETWILRELGSIEQGGGEQQPRR